MNQDPIEMTESPQASSAAIRVGSPFAVDPTGIIPTKPVEVFYDVGSLRYTAMGSVAAATMVIGFALAALLWFPAGGALIAGLGCLLSIFGLYSSYRKSALLLLFTHLGIFVMTYFRSLS